MKTKNSQKLFFILKKQILIKKKQDNSTFQNGITKIIIIIIKLIKLIS
jgi:hypothetical protein